MNTTNKKQRTKGNTSTKGEQERRRDEKAQNATTNMEKEKLQRQKRKIENSQQEALREQIEQKRNGEIGTYEVENHQPNTLENRSNK